MEISATRDQIRDRLIAKIGWATAIGVDDHYNELIRAASVHVGEECQWASARREVRVSIGVDQRFLAYPANCGAVGLQEIGLWDANGKFYKKLTRHTIGVVRDTDPTNDLGGVDDEVTRGEPVWYEPGEQIEIYPTADIIYEAKIIYTLSTELTTGLQVSAVDAELILLWASADAYQQIGDEKNASDCRSKYALRLGKIQRRMQTAFNIPLAPEAECDEEWTERPGYYGTP